MMTFPAFYTKVEGGTQLTEETNYKRSEVQLAVRWCLILGTLLILSLLLVHTRFLILQLR